MGTCETWCSTRFGIGSITVSDIYIYIYIYIIYIYIYDIPLSISKLANSILFSDDRTIIISNTNPDKFKNNINSVMTEITNWFQSNLLTLNCNKTHFMQFLTKKRNERKIQITAPNSINTNIHSTKFLGLIIDNTLSWKDHIAGLTSKLNKACYAIRSIKPFFVCGYTENDLFFYVQSVMSYGIIFEGNSHHSNSIFKIKKNHYKYW